MDIRYGIAQGSVLAPYLFNIYLQEALLSDDTLKELIRRKDLLAYADDIAIFTKSDAEIRQIIEAFKRIEASHNLRINLKKCEIMRIKGGSTNIKSIEGIEVKDSVRYLGLKIVTSKKQQK